MLGEEGFPSFAFARYANCPKRGPKRGNFQLFPWLISVPGGDSEFPPTEILPPLLLGEFGLRRFTASIFGERPFLRFFLLRQKGVIHRIHIRKASRPRFYVNHPCLFLFRTCREQLSFQASRDFKTTFLQFPTTFLQ